MAKHASISNDFPYLIYYPQGWHISDNKKQVVFYQDDPDEGIAFIAVPYGGLKGELNANDLLKLLLPKLQQSYPDYQVSVQNTQVDRFFSAPSRSYILDAEARWTGARRQPMRALIRLRTIYAPQSNPAENSTLVRYLSGQAPAPLFDAWRPVYAKMVNSLIPEMNTPIH